MGAARFLGLIRKRNTLYAVFQRTTGELATPKKAFALTEAGVTRRLQDRLNRTKHFDTEAEVALRGFGGADRSDIKTWSQFRASNPQLPRTLQYVRDGQVVVGQPSKLTCE